MIARDNVPSSLTCRDRIALLRQAKLQQTRQKIDRYGAMDEDDYGTVVAPEAFGWQPIPTHPNGQFYGARGWGKNFRALMEAYPTHVEAVNALAGRCVFFLSRIRAERGNTWHPDFDYPHLKEEQERYNIVSGIGADSHFGGDYRIGLELGWGGLLKKVRHFRAQHGPEHAEFFAAEEDVILGIQNWIGRTVQHIHRAMEEEPRPELRQNLWEMAQVNEHLIEQPPRTFREACQWLAQFNIASRTYNRDGAGGQLDELLLPYYERDTAAGILDDEAAIYSLACLLLLDTRYYQIGGPDAAGGDLTNRVSYLILEAAHRLGIAVNLTVRVHEKLDPEFFRRSVRHLFEDRKGWPRYAGDKALVEGFCRNGFSPELARQRIAVGCHWTALPGREYTLNDCVKINVAKVFEVAFWEMMNDPARSPGMDNLWGRFESHLRQAVLCTARGLDWHLDHQKEVQPELLLNLLCHGPIEKGRDAADGGVEFYNMCIDGCGLATLADSFAALEQRLEKQKLLNWSRLAEHLQSNYAGADGERVRLMLRSSERYGQGNSLGDQWAMRVSRLLTDLVKEKPTPGGRNLIPGWFSWSNTISLGKAVAATPNGRKAHQPISHGANPDPGFRRDGAPTAMARSIAAIQCGYGNTCPMQLELDPGLCQDEEGIEKVAALIKTHFDLGGTLLNVNILDAQRLREAHQDPSKYPDLVVRVTGFTAYFAALSPEFRQLVVDRLIGG